jgi:hypothetical protein
MVIMKKDTKILLQEALRALPNDRDYSPIRYSIKKAITEIAQVESKQNRKRPLTPAEQWKLNLETGTLTHPAATRLQPTLNPLKILDEMIGQEKKKLEELKKPKENPGTQPLLG